MVGEVRDGDGEAVRERHQDVQAAEAVAGGDAQPGGATALVLCVVDVEL
ncbi:hypothetical protein OG298_44480 (plasmid) [Streptomyces sp. NBC_01005]|nr:hypothetical protein [Streptomyces sp. NBC_01362]WSW11270.1 hypothetical protein OG298_44480 [Streptomyces sp. NBC_01005]WTD00778.1 hypothetical protein OH736_44480 [Streptomyces sp. NBC_01650]